MTTCHADITTALANVLQSLIHVQLDLLADKIEGNNIDRP